MATLHLTKQEHMFAKLEAAAEAAHLQSFGAIRVPDAHRARVAAALNRCIEATTDSEKTYAIAATNVRDGRLRVVLHDQAKRRGALVCELQGMLESLGCFAENEGTVRGALRRGLLDLKLVVGGRSSRVLLADCDRADDRALEVYEGARNDLADLDLPVIRAMVDMQRGVIFAGRSGIRRLLADAR